MQLPHKIDELTCVKCTSEYEYSNSDFLLITLINVIMAFEFFF